MQSKSIDYKHGWREEEKETRKRHLPERYEERDYPPEPAPPPKPKTEVVAIGTLLEAPGRDTRPERVMNQTCILRFLSFYLPYLWQVMNFQKLCVKSRLF